LKVLLAKDMLTLRRNKGFLIAFLTLPFILMGAFALIKGAVDDGLSKEDLIEQYFYYTGTPPSPLYQIDDDDVDNDDVPPFYADQDDLTKSHARFTGLYKFIAKNRAKYQYSKVAIVSDRKDVRDNAQKYFEKYVLQDIPEQALPPLHPPQSSANPKEPKMAFGPYIFETDEKVKWTVETFETRDQLWEAVRKEDKSPYAFALTFGKFEPEKNEYEVQFHFSKTDVPDTTLTAYNPLVKMPDLKSWELWFK
jgi:hypothetical protein